MGYIEDLLRKLLAKHGIAANDCRKIEHDGVANDVWFCDDYVVRINKDREYESDSLAESVAAPAAFAAGVRSPKPIAFDFDRDVIPELVSIYKRIEGASLAKTPELADERAFFRDLGRQLRLLHENVVAVPDPRSWLDEAWHVTADGVIENCRANASPDIAETAMELAKALDAPIPEGRAFVHQDLHAGNLVVDALGMPWIIDWGDAGFGDPAADFRYVPACFLPDCLAGYGSHEPGLLKRVGLHQIDQYVYLQARGIQAGRYGMSDWPEIVVFCEQIERGEVSCQRMSDRLMAIGTDCAPRLKDVPDHNDLLYDENGMPK